VKRLTRRVILVSRNHADNELILRPLQVFARFFSVKRLEDRSINAVRYVPNVQAHLFCHALAELTHHDRLCGLPYLCQHVCRHRLMVDRKPGKPGQTDVLILDYPRVHQCHNRVRPIPLRVSTDNILPIRMLEHRVDFNSVNIQNACLHPVECSHANTTVK